MAMLSNTSRRHSLLPRFVLTRLSNSVAKSAAAVNASDADTTSLALSASSPLSASAAKSLLLKEYDPDKALSIMSSVPYPPSSPTSSRFSVKLTILRLATACRFEDIESLLESRKSDPAAAQESFVGIVILAYGSACMLDHAISTFEDVCRLCSVEILV